MFEHARLSGNAAVFAGRQGRELEIRIPRARQASLGWDGALDQPSYAVIDGPPTATPGLTETPTGWRVAGPGISMDVSPDGTVTSRDQAGQVRRCDPAPQWLPDGWRLRTRLPAGASVHGLGGRSMWNLAGRTLRFWNTDPGGAWWSGDDPLSVTTPVFATLDDVGAVHCFIDNAWDGTLAVTEEEVVAQFSGGPVRWHISLGTLAQCLSGYTALTGRPAAPPRWALGHHQARWGYGSSDAVREVWRGFRQHDLPVSALHLDIDHMDRFRNFTAGPQFRDLGELAEQLRSDDIRTVVIVDAGTARAEDSPTYRDGMQRGVFCRREDGEVFEGTVWPGPTVFPDFTAPAVRQWWGSQFAAPLGLGIAGFWHDMNEPACFAEDGGETTLPLDTRHDLDGHPADHRAAHNVYGLLMCRATYEGLRLLAPDRRPFLFSRSGWAGMQRYGGHWSGDIGTDWSSLAATIHQALAFGISAVGYYGPDIGGFTGHPSAELFTRWFQLASFLPFFRTHCAFTAPRREPWEWGEEVLALLRASLQRRYRLLPYWYTLALQAGRDGAPYVRPLSWEDPALRTVEDEFLVGPDVLVAPVLQEGATHRDVVFPGGVWCHGETGAQFAGSASFPVGPADTPWFIRAGAVVPTEEDGRLVLLAAPPDESQHGTAGVLLTDAGDGWEVPHEERYRCCERSGVVVVEREIVRPGTFPFSGVAVRALGGRPARLL